MFTYKLAGLLSSYRIYWTISFFFHSDYFIKKPNYNLDFLFYSLKIQEAI